MASFEISGIKSAQATQSSIDFSSTGDNTLVAGVSGQTIRIWRLFLVVSAATNLKFWDGPSSSGTGLTGVMNMVANGSIVLDLEGDPWFVTSSGNGFVLNQSGTAQVSGRVYYSQSQ